METTFQGHEIALFFLEVEIIASQDVGHKELFLHIQKYVSLIRSLFSKEIQSDLYAGLHLFGLQLAFLIYFYDVDTQTMDDITAHWFERTSKLNLSSDEIIHLSSIVSNGCDITLTSLFEAEDSPSTSIPNNPFYISSKVLFKLFDLPYDVMLGAMVSAALSEYLILSEPYLTHLH